MRYNCCSWVGCVKVVLWTLITLSFTGYLMYFYIGNPSGDWRILPDICCSLWRKLPLYIHIMGAAVVLWFGPVQMLNTIHYFRFHRVKFHKWTGIVYIIGCILASLGGLGFIILNGTVGRINMTIAFSVAGVLTFIFAMITSYFAVKGPTVLHRTWAIRLYALASSSVFYRVLYFAIYPVIRRLFGNLHGTYFHAPLDIAFDWLYFVVPMIVAEIYLYIRWKNIYCFKDIRQYPINI